MAVLKVRNSNGKASLGGAKDYLERDGRNVECSTFNIDRPEEWAEDMQLTKELFDKTEGRQYYWIVQSFDNEHGEQSYNAEDVHEMGKELAEVFAKKGYQVVVETHNDTDNLHNHLIINSVNSETGKKLRISNAKSLEVSKGADILTTDLYRLNDEICKKYGLRTLDQSKALSV